MSRAQDFLDAAVVSARAAAQTLDDGDATRLIGAADKMESMRERFFFKSLAGVPLANKAKKAAASLENGGGPGVIDALEGIVAEMLGRLDQPGAVLT
jgi:hypothetical protein